MTDPATDPAPPAAPPARGWTRTILILSLAVNLLLVGLITGAVLRSGPPGWGGMLGELNLGPVTEALSKADKAELRRAFLRDHPDFRTQRRDAQQDVAAILDVLRAPVLDRPALEAIFLRQSERSAKRMDRARTAVLDVIAAMSPEDRRAFGDRLEQALTRRARGPAP